MNIFKKKRHNSLQPSKENIAGQHIIRDFIYLDIERIRSYVAQFYGGLTTQRVSNNETKNSFSGSIKAGVPIGLNMGADTERYFIKSNQETKSLHDNIFNEFYQALSSTDSLLQIPDNNNQCIWDESTFVDGSFLLVNGAIQLIDYKYITHIINTFPSITKDLERVVSSPSISNSKSQIQQATDTRKQISQMPTKEMANLLTEFYGDKIGIKYYPFLDAHHNVLKGFVEQEHFRHQPISIMQVYGNYIDAGWISVLQVNRGSKIVKNSRTAPDDNSMESSLDSFVSTLGNFHQTIVGISFPAVSVTTIAIFRETTIGR